MMFSNMDDNSFFTQKIKIKKKFSNKELILIQFFHDNTKFFPENIILSKKLIFFFVDNTNEYLIAKSHLRSIRNQLQGKKVLIIRAEKILIKQLFSFFPDPYIHDVKLDISKRNGLKIVTVYFLSFFERGIAIGRKGGYIKAVNEIFEKYVIFENDLIPIKIKCEIINL